ncbi:hypothetical protein O181_009597 [Austropuccinia psidii MF-1]|uniref:Uncharacterized protein n=1 Tax=Austropuccinia psidii MF-1 TaxID=1389203 RepID=A0A9Q3BR20_9BASI|nr:hypothetical protein [Austropuccinia psidii MF-1]
MSFRPPALHLQNHLSLCFHTPNAYYAYACTVPYRYAFDTVTPSWPSTILALIHPLLILSAAYDAYTPAVPYRNTYGPSTSSLTFRTPWLLLLWHLTSLCFHSTPASYPQLTMLMLPHFPLMVSISHPYAHKMIVFCTEGCSFLQLTILTLMERIISIEN